MFLTIGMQYAFDQLNVLRDEVIDEWRTTNGTASIWVCFDKANQEDCQLEDWGI